MIASRAFNGASITAPGIPGLDLRGAVDAASKERMKPWSAELSEGSSTTVLRLASTGIRRSGRSCARWPRPLLVHHAIRIAKDAAGRVRECVAAAQRAYREAGVQERFMLHLQPEPDTRSRLKPMRRARLVRRWLKPQRS